jgi:glutamate-5-semialdehyde dehydrogenase
MNELLIKAEQLQQAAKTLSLLSTEEKNEALTRIAEALIKQKEWILQENEKDVALGKEQGLSPALIDRLQLTSERIEQIVDGVRQVASLPDPIGEIVEEWTRPNGLRLCLKTGNAVLLRGSSSALHSNKALVHVMKEALRDSAIPADAIQLLEDTSREVAQQMFRLNGYLDVLIPRGGAGLIRSVIENATVPVLETGVGNCHIFIDESAQKQMAIDIVLNAKLQRPSVCNAVETVLIHQNWPYVNDLVETLHARGVELRGDSQLASSYSFIQQATEADWSTEYLAPILAVKLVQDVKEAVDHINRYGTKHSEAIISEQNDNVRFFFQATDAAVLYHNASTRFTDGEQFGYGAEIGISTQKLHARGPMGLRAITTTKSLVYGTGQIRS